MHACDLVEVAALIAQQSPYLIHAPSYVSENGLQAYWTASKCRADRWMRGLPVAARMPDDGPVVATIPPAAWNQPLMEEVLAGEMLTRVWTGVACGIDARHGHPCVASIARNVWVGQLEGRHRVLQLLVNSPNSHHRTFVLLNAVRRRLERWTDMLIGCMLDEYDATEFAFDADRAREFSRDLRRDVQRNGVDESWSLIMSALQSAFRSMLSRPSPNADLNRQIVSSLLGSFTVGMFDAIGDLSWLWQMRLSQATADIQGMIDRLIEEEARDSGVLAQRSSLRFGAWRSGKRP